IRRPTRLVSDWSSDVCSSDRYAAIRQLGREGIAEMVERACACAGRFGDALRELEGVEVLNDVVLNQALVRFGDSDDTTRAVIDRSEERRVGREGRAGLGR